MNSGALARLILIALWLAFMLSSAPAQAQTACPFGGYITATVTYTLTGNCQLNQPLNPSGHNITVTINGGGHTITHAPESSFTPLAGFKGFIFGITSAGNTPTILLNDVTLDANGKNLSPGLIVSKLTANRVTLQGVAGGSWAAIASGHVWSLTDVLFRDNTGKIAVNEPATVEVKSGGSLTMRNVAFERNLSGPAALSFLSGSTVSASGCLSDVASVPRFVKGSFSHSLPACAGTVGNGDSLSTAAAAAQACGFPAGGEVRANATFTLNADCQMTGDLYITEGVTVTVNGGGRAIRGAQGGTMIWVSFGSRLNLNNVALRGVRINNWGRIEAEILAVYELSQRFLLDLGTANFNRLLLDNLDFSAANSYAIVSYSIFGKGVTTIRDGIFRDITNGASRATLWALGSGASITLVAGSCASFINNSPEETKEQNGGVISNRSSGACPASLIENFFSPPQQPTAEASPPQQPTAEASPQPPGGNGGTGGTGNGNGDGGRGRSRGGDSAAMAPTPVRLSPPDTCAALFPDIQVTNRSPGTNCQRVSGWAIGHPDLIAAHPDRVVDVWGWITPETLVCFPAQSGSIRFVDTTVMPRALAPLPAFSSGALLCARIDRPGQVALIADGSPPAFSQGQPPAAPTPQYAARRLSDCMVRAKYSLNFRDAPAGQRIGGVPHNAVLTALARTPGWFKVDLHGAKGWIAAMYVEPMGVCG